MGVLPRANDRAGGINLLSYWLRSSPPCIRLEGTRGYGFCHYTAAARGLVFRLMVAFVLWLGFIFGLLTTFRLRFATKLIDCVRKLLD